VLHWATKTFPFNVLGTPMIELGALPLQVNAVELTGSTLLEESCPEPPLICSDPERK
jgi:hypothetical protein